MIPITYREPLICYHVQGGAIKVLKKGTYALWDWSSMPPDPCNTYPMLTELAAEVWQDRKHQCWALNHFKLLLAKVNLKRAVRGNLSPPWYWMPLRKVKIMQFPVSKSPDQPVNFSSTPLRLPEESIGLRLTSALQPRTQCKCSQPILQNLSLAGSGKFSSPLCAPA